MTYTRQYYAAMVFLASTALMSLGINYLDFEYSGATPEVLEIDMEPMTGEILPPPKLHHKKPVVKSRASTACVRYNFSRSYLYF